MDGDDVTLGTGLPLKLVGFGFDRIKVYFRVAVMSDPVELTDMLDAMEMEASGDLKLSGGKVDSRNHFCGRMFDLETGVKLEEVEVILRAAVDIQIFVGQDKSGVGVVERLTLDGSGADVSNKLGQSNGSTLHLLKSILLRDCHQGFFDDFLVPALDGTVATKERDRVAILISK